MKDEEAVFFWSFMEICSCSFSYPVFPLLFKVQTAILITFSYGIFQVWIAIIFESFTKYAQYLPILAARGDKADHCWYHFNQIQTFKFGWYHLPCGEPISACASFVNLLSQFASNMLCDFNMLPMPFSQASAWVPNFPISQMATSSTHPVVLELRRDSMRSVGWLGWLCWLGWGRKNTGMTWNGHCFSSRHLGISCCCIWHHLTRKDGRRMDEGWTKVSDVSDVFLWPLENLTGHTAIRGRVPRKPEPESCDLRWSQMISGGIFISNSTYSTLQVCQVSYPWRSKGCDISCYLPGQPIEAFNRTWQVVDHRIVGIKRINIPGRHRTIMITLRNNPWPISFPTI